MSVEITFLGHSGFVFASGQHRVAVDPFLTGNPVAKHKPEDIKCQYVVLTHGHADHVGDSAAIAKANDATVIAVFEVAGLMASQGVKKTEPGNPGGKIETDFGWVAFTQAIHSSSYEGQYMGMPTGVMVNIGGVTIYHLGDTTIFGDMKLLGEIYRPAIACVPVGDRFTMGPELATRAAEMIAPKVAIPIHFGTFPMIRPNADGFAPKGIEVKVLEPGQTWNFG